MPGRVVLFCTVLVLACAGRDLPTTVAHDEPLEDAASPAVICTADVRSGTVACGQPAPVLRNGARALVLGGQDVFVHLESSNVCYDAACPDGAAGDELFRFDVTVRNLIPQPLGTADGVSAHADGVRVFFGRAPRATVGVGMISVANADGEHTFLGSEQPFFRYLTMLAPDAQSGARRWHLHVPAGVTTFDFGVYVDGAVPYPDGWVDVTPAAVTVRPGDVIPLTAVALDAVGRTRTDAVISWTTSDPAVATVDDAGVVTATGPGAVTITATSDGAEAAGAPAFAVTTGSVTRLWAGGATAAPDAWTSSLNWAPAGTPAAPDVVEVGPADDPAVLDGVSGAASHVTVRGNTLRITNGGTLTIRP